MSVALLPKLRPEGAHDDETAEEASERLHNKKNKPANPVEDMDFPPYRFFPYPTAVYRKWDVDEREQELYKVAGRNNLDLDKRRDRFTAEALVGDYETRNVGVTDFTRSGRNGVNVEISSELRERNDREYAAMLEQGWASSPSGVKDATRRLQIKLATAAAEREGEDQHMGEKAYAEMRAVDDAADNHVVNVSETRKQLQAEGKLPKERK